MVGLSVLIKQEWGEISINTCQGFNTETGPNEKNIRGALETEGSTEYGG